MTRGDCFLIRNDAVNDHLQIVISDPLVNSQRVLIVSLTTFNDTKEDACLFNANEHPFIKHQSCIAYDFAKVTTSELLEQFRCEGMFIMQPPMSELQLKRIWNGAANSTRLKMDFADLLAEQGLIEI